jgi:hypothetical protein
MTARRLLAPLAALAGACALTAPAAAAPPWSAPASVATTAVGDPTIAFGTSSTGVAALSFGSVGTGGHATRILSLAAGAGTPTASRDVGSVAAGPLPYARTRTVSLRLRQQTLGYSFGRTDGAVGTFRTLRRVVLRPGEAELAVSPNGNAIVAFAEQRSGGGSTRVWVSTRRASSSRFTTPRVIRGSGSARSLAVSINDRGRWIVAYGIGASGHSIEARLGTLSGGVGKLEHLGPHLGIASVTAIVAQTGRTTVAWATHDGGEEQNKPTEIRVAVLPAGRQIFRSPVLLDRGEAAGVLATEPAPPSLAAAPNGTTVLGYTLSGRFVGTGVAGDANAVTPARASVQDASARFGPPQELAADGVVGRVAARADGTFAVPYAQGVTLEPSASPLFVALRMNGAPAFAPGELVATDAADLSAAAFEPGATGAPVVLYLRAQQGGAALSRRAG